MSHDTQSFRSAVLGFDRNDVINYIETLTREHQEEIAAFRNAAEILRRERDEARRLIEGQENQIEHLREDGGEIARLNRELEARRAGAAETGAKLEEARQALRRAESETAALKARADGEMAALRAQMEGETAGVRAQKETEIAALRAQNEELARQYEAVNRAKLRADDMEMMACRRAREIEDEAAQKAERTRDALSRLILDARGKYAAAKGDAETVARGALASLNNVLDWFDHFPRLFDEIGNTLDGAVAEPSPPQPALPETLEISEASEIPETPQADGEIEPPEPPSPPEPEPPEPEPPEQGRTGQADTPNPVPAPLDPSSRLSVIIQRIGTDKK